MLWTSRGLLLFTCWIVVVDVLTIVVDVYTKNVNNNQAQFVNRFTYM